MESFRTFAIWSRGRACGPASHRRNARIVFHCWVKGGISVWRDVLTPYRRRRQFVPDDLKDDKYWARRRKNNMAAKRSRDARRMKENQIALRAGYLEKEVSGFRRRRRSL